MTNAKPQKIQLLKWGVNESTEGPVIVNELTLSSFAAMQRKIGRERVPLDWEHNTVPGTPEYERTQEPRPIAAMATPVVNQDGLFLTALTYTATGDQLSNFEDISAAPLLNKDRVVVGLHSAGLTRTGAIYGAHFAAGDCLKLAGEGISLASFASKISAAVLAADASEKQQQQQTEKENTMTVTLESLSAQIVELTKSLDTRIAALEANKPVDIAPLSARVDELVNANKATATAALEAEKNTILPLFASEGKAPVNPLTKKPYTADELKALDVPTLRVLHANTPATVPLKGGKPAGETNASGLKGLARAIAAHVAESK